MTVVILLYTLGSIFIYATAYPYLCAIALLMGYPAKYPQIKCVAGEGESG